MLAFLLAVGTVPALSLLTVDGAPARLATSEARATVVVFVSTVCPVSNDYADRYVALFQNYSRSGVQFAFVYSNKTESPDDIRRHTREGRYPFPVYRDRANVLADELGAALTPTAYVIDQAGRIRYKGRVDDATNPVRVRDRSLENALRAVLDGRAVERPETKAFG